MKITLTRLEVLWAVCVAVTLVALSGMALAGADWSPTDKPLVWVDKNGKVIGRAVGSNGVQVRLEGLDLILPVSNRQVCSAPFICDLSLDVQWGGVSAGASFGGPVVYSLPQCKGEARIVSIAPGSARAVAVIGLTLASQKLYVGVNSPSSQFTYQSTLFPEGTCQDAPFPFTQSAWKIDKTVDLKNLPFRPPFYLK